MSASLALDRTDIYSAGDYKLAKRIATPRGPSHMTFSADSSTVYITLERSNEVAFIDLGTQKVSAVHPVGKAPVGIWLTPDGKHLLVGLLGEDHVVVMDAKSGKIIKRITTAKGTHNFAAMGDKRRLLVSNRVANSISIIDMSGEIKIVNNKDINFAYRNSSITKNQIITNVEMKGAKLDKQKILENMKYLKNKKDTEQPQKIKTGGSTFKNPKDSNKKAWQLIKESGCSDLRIGDIKLSNLHCNFLENLGKASSEDVENLIKNIKEAVFKKTNINLELELEVIGEK